MTLKAIELQVALPRTYDASKLQDQLGKKSMHDQEQMSASQMQIDNQNRKKSTELIKSDPSMIKDQQNHHDNHSSTKKENKEEKDKKDDRMSHPYKGHTIDLSL